MAEQELTLDEKREKIKRLVEKWEKTGFLDEAKRKKGRIATILESKPMPYEKTDTKNTN